MLSHSDIRVSIWANIEFPRDELKVFDIDHQCESRHIFMLYVSRKSDFFQVISFKSEVFALKGLV